MELPIGGKKVVVLWEEIDKDYQKVSKMTEEELEDRCVQEKGFILTDDQKSGLAFRDKPLLHDFSNQAEEFVEKFCDKPLASVESFTKTRQLDKKTRECFEETETNQFVCSENKTNKEELSWDEWVELKTHYTYFRY